MQATHLIAAVLLTLGGLAASPQTLAGPPGEQSSPFVAGGPHVDVEFPSDPGTVVDEERALATATCGVAVPISPLPYGLGPPDEVGQALDGFGGNCFDVTRYPASALLSVTVARTPGSVPENREHFAVGYDGDDDGCVGCSTDDALWRGVGSVEVPVLASERALVVFVYAASGSNPPSEGGQPLETATVGQITVRQTGTAAVDCGDEPGAPEGGCGVELDQPRPHLCVPFCEPAVD